QNVRVDSSLLLPVDTCSGPLTSTSSPRRMSPARCHAERYRRCPHTSLQTYLTVVARPHFVLQLRNHSHCSRQPPEPTPTISVADSSQAQSREMAPSAVVPRPYREAIMLGCSAVLDSTNHPQCSLVPAFRSPCNPARRSEHASGPAIPRHARLQGDPGPKPASAIASMDEDRKSHRDRRHPSAESQSTGASRSRRALHAERQCSIHRRHHAGRSQPVACCVRCSRHQTQRVSGNSAAPQFPPPPSLHPS